MKKVAFIIVVSLLAMMVLSAGCAAKPSVATAQNVIGELKYLSVPLEGGNATLTIQTPQGPQNIQLAANTTYELNGKACAIDEIGKALVAGDTTYNCTAVINPCEPGIVAQYLSVFTITK